MLTQVPPWHGLEKHSSISSEHVGPLKPAAHIHLYLLPGNIEQVPLFLQGVKEHKFDFSQNFPEIEKKFN